MLVMISKRIWWELMLVKSKGYSNIASYQNTFVRYKEKSTRFDLLAFYIKQNILEILGQRYIAYSLNGIVGVSDVKSREAENDLNLKNEGD